MVMVDQATRRLSQWRRAKGYYLSRTMNYLMAKGRELRLLLLQPTLLSRIAICHGLYSLKYNSEEVAACHESFIQALRETSEAYIEAVFGVPVRKAIFHDKVIKYDRFYRRRANTRVRNAWKSLMLTTKMRKPYDRDQCQASRCSVGCPQLR